MTLSHSFFGELTLDPTLNWYEVELDWGEKRVQLYLSMNDCPSADELFRTAESLWKDQHMWDQRLRKYAADQLLQLKNDAWLDEDEDDVTADAFYQCMTTKSIVVYPHDRFQFTFDDGDLFWGHVIQVSGDLIEGPTGANIAG